MEREGRALPPEVIKQIEEKRAQSDKAAVEDGAEYKREGGWKGLLKPRRLEFTQAQVEEARGETDSEMERRQQEIEARKITVRNALNPYHYSVDSILHTYNIVSDSLGKVGDNKKEDITFDPTVTLKEDMASYSDVGLSTWADGIKTVDLDHLTSEKRTTIEQEIRDGAIAIVMPGREIQRKTTPDQYKKSFRPFKKGISYSKDHMPTVSDYSYFESERVNDGVIPEVIERIINREREDGSVVRGIPEGPYILLVKRNKSLPDARTTDFTSVSQQTSEIEQKNTRRQQEGKAPVFPIQPTEYGALQNRFTERLKTRVEASGIRETTFSPIQEEVSFLHVSSSIDPFKDLDPTNLEENFVLNAQFERSGSRETYNRILFSGKHRTQNDPRKEKPTAATILVTRVEL